MTDAVRPVEPRERPPAPEPAAALPLDAHDVVASVDAGLRARILHDSLARTIWRIALPAIVSSLLLTLFASVDAYWVGTRIGAEGLAAVSTSLFWIWVIVSLAEMVSVGLTAVAARRHGEGRPDDAARAVGDAVLFAVALGLVVSVAGLLALDHLFAWMHTPPGVTALGRRYLGAWLVGAPLVYGYFAVDAGFRASGNTRTPFALLAAATSVTLVLDPALILGLGGLPRLGIIGAGVAGSATRGIGFAVGLWLLVRARLVRFARPNPATLALIARIGLPTALTGVLFSLIYVALTPITTRFGTPALAALGLGHRVESWLFMIGVGGGAAAAAVVGQNLGAGQPARAARAGWITLAFTSVPGLIMCVLELAIPRQLAAIFTHDPVVIVEAARYLSIAAWSQLVVTAEIVLEGALGGAGYTLPPMVASTALTALRIPLAAWAAARWGAVGIWWTISLTAVSRGLAMMALWRAGRWQRTSV